MAARRTFDYSQQLDLFGGADVDSWTATTEESPDVREKPARADDPRTLAEAPSADGRGAAGSEPVGPDDLRSPGDDRGPAVRTGISPENGLPGGLGDRDARVGAVAEPEPSAIILAADADDPPATPSRDFRITAAHRIGEGSPREKALANLDAIRTLKQLEAEDRDATDFEKAVLARYSGWGALANVFELHPPREWEKTAEELRKLLTADEYASARASTPNAHFTSPAVISAVWQALERLGLADGAQILEPSMGVGHFFGLMPEAFTPGARRTGVELDSLTARIAQRLYPDATIFAKGFEETSLPENFFDAVVGNIPFGNYPVFDPSYRSNPAVTRAIHDYFFAKALDKARPGGMVALITSRYTMDKQDGTIRQYLAERANLIGAIRLPNTAFKANAGTEVTTDIVFLQKHGQGVPVSAEAWRELASIESPDGPILVNEYFARHQEMMLGQMRLEGKMYRGGEPALVGEVSETNLARAIASLPAALYVARAANASARAEMTPAEATGLGTVKEGAFCERDGVIVVRSGNRFESANLTASAAARVRGMLAVRDAVRLVFQTQLEDAPEKRITEARQALGAVYDSFVARYGPVSSRENVKAFAGDPDHPLLLSLENYDPDLKTATKTAIFEQRTLERYRPVEHVETAAEALAVSLNETAEIRVVAYGAAYRAAPRDNCGANWAASSIAIRKVAAGRPPTDI